MARRQWHIYLGCFFAPLLIYFCLSGAWQTFRWNDLPRGRPATAADRFFNEFSNPHKNALLPGANPRTERPAILFQSLAAIMALGFVTSAILGVQLGWQVPRRRKWVALCLAAGTFLPILFLFLTGPRPPSETPARAANSTPGATSTDRPGDSPRERTSPRPPDR